jgi:hypothetical protein
VQGNDPAAQAVTKSIRAFKSMEETYVSGAAALEHQQAGVTIRTVVAAFPHPLASEALQLQFDLPHCATGPAWGRRRPEVFED